MWEPQVRSLVETHRVLTYDHRGHGASEVPRGPYTLFDITTDLATLLDDLELDRVSFCGLSMGGAVGMMLAAAAPHRVDRLILACTAARFASREIWEARIETVRAEGVEAIADAVLDRFFTDGFRERSPETVARVRKTLVGTPREGYAGCCEALREHDATDILDLIDAPTLVIAGSVDPSTPPQQGAFLAETIADAGLHVIEGAAHLANVEHPDEFTAALLGHLRTA